MHTSKPMQRKFGGPIVDVSAGAVIGLNAAKGAHMEGGSFAAPISKVKEIMYK